MAPKTQGPTTGRLLGGAVIGGAAGIASLGSAGTLGLGGVAAGLSLQALGWARLVPLLIGSTFVTRFRIDVFGANFRPEHFVLAVCLVAMLMAGRAQALMAAASNRTVVLFACFVAWSALVSVLTPPEPGESLLIVGWLALDLVMLVVLLASTNNSETLARSGVLWTGWASAAAIVFWLVGRSSGAPFVASDGAAIGLSFEPNLLGATLAMWAFVAFTGVHSLSRRTRTVVVALAVTGLGLSLTRAAMAGLALGLLVWAALQGTRAKARALRLLGSLIAVSALLVAVAPGAIDPVSEDVSNTFEFGTGTGQQRVESWRTAIDDLDGFDWVVGLGTNSFGQRHLEPTLPTTPTPQYLANLPLQVVYDTGIVGALLLVATLLSLFRRRRLRDGRALGLLTVYLACAVATSPFWYGTTWVLVAIAVLHDRPDPKVSRPLVARNRGGAGGDGDLELSETSRRHSPYQRVGRLVVDQGPRRATATKSSS
jgi:hypothetical protein